MIAIPGKDRESCTAYQIASGAVPEIKDKEIIPVVFPMTKNETVLRESHEAAVQSLTALMDQGKTIAFLTLGDVTIYSTYGYVHQKLLSLGYESILVNGSRPSARRRQNSGSHSGKRRRRSTFCRDPIRSQTDWSSREQRS